MAELTVYEKPTCTTCKNLALHLQEKGIEFDKVDYHVFPLSEEEIRALVAKTGGSARDVLRTREPLAARYEDASEDELFAAMAEHPELLQRPIVVRGDRAVLARPVERVDELL